MMAALKSEFRKLLTVRSTYFLFLLAFALSSFLGFWVYGYKDVEHAALNHSALLSSIFSAVSVTGVFLSFLAVLAVGHEYRYNTIMYTLTSTNRRAKTFVTKLAAVTALALCIAAVTTLANIGLFYLGQHLNHVQAVGQHIAIFDTLWHSVVTIVGDIAYAFIITIVIRSLIGAIAIVLILPTTIEQLLTLLLHDNTKYLPYTALGNLTEVTSKMAFTTSLWTVTAYVFGGLLVGLVLFVRRDAN
jgi:ABC-2 type transport system permease protein